MSGLDIDERHIGSGSPCLIIGEVAQAHEGSLTLAHAYIDAIADAGADAVKFQCRIAASESHPNEQWRVEPEWPQDRSRYEYWKRMEFKPDQWAGLAKHAKSRGLMFLCSPFSVEAVEMLDRYVPAWKIASGEVTNDPLCAAIAHTRKPVLISTGMLSWPEIDDADGRFYGLERAYLQCTSAYPCPPESIGLNVLSEMRDRYHVPIGLSDHSGTVFAGLAAVALGCELIEVHVTMSRESQGFDTPSSITFPELARLVEGVRWIETARASPVSKDVMARSLEPMRSIFMGRAERKAAYDTKRTSAI